MKNKSSIVITITKMAAALLDLKNISLKCALLFRDRVDFWAKRLHFQFNGCIKHGTRVRFPLIQCRFSCQRRTVAQIWCDLAPIRCPNRRIKLMAYSFHPPVVIRIRFSYWPHVSGKAAPLSCFIVVVLRKVASAKNKIANISRISRKSVELDETSSECG